MKRIGVFTSGGDSPGMNACLRAVVHTAQHHGVDVYGIEQGFEGMMLGQVSPLAPARVRHIMHRSGTILRSSRSPRFRSEEGRAAAANVLHEHGIDGLIAIGGNGTFAGANVLHAEHGVPVIGLPGTIDNDLFGTDFTIGYSTALRTVTDALDMLRATAESHGRVFFVEVMGRDSGYIALNAGIAGGADAILLPERPTNLDQLADFLRDRPAQEGSLVVVAEGDDQGGALDLAKAVRARLPHLPTRTTVLGHVQRGGIPTPADRILATRLGIAAVEALLAGKECLTLGEINGNVVETPFSQAISQTKALDPALLHHPDMLIM